MQLRHRTRDSLYRVVSVLRGALWEASFVMAEWLSRQSSPKLASLPAVAREALCGHRVSRTHSVWASSSWQGSSAVELGEIRVVSIVSMHRKYRSKYSQYRKYSKYSKYSKYDNQGKYSNYDRYCRYHRQTPWWYAAPVWTKADKAETKEKYRQGGDRGTIRIGTGGRNGQCGVKGMKRTAVVVCRDHQLYCICTEP